MRLVRYRAASVPAAVLFALSTLACSTVTPPTAPAPELRTAAAVEEPFSWEETTRDFADALVAESRQLAAEGRTDEARDRLDDALCAVLDTPEGYEERPAYLEYLSMLFAETARLDDGRHGQPVDEVVELPELVEDAEIVDEVASVGSGPGPSGGIELVLNPTVAGFVDAYTRPGKYRNRIEAGLLRAGRYLPMIRNELALRDLPVELAYLPLIESAFSVSATSPARAHGMWQFIASTARLCGLRVDALVDERRDPVLSTRAAVAHLADLHAQFGDWELALAAYNSGAGNVRRAIRATGSRDFWTLRRRLPRETRNYVPAFVAAVLVGRDPTRYGLPQPTEEPWTLEPVEVDDALDLEFVAARLELDRDLLRDLNPAIRRGLTPASSRSTLWLPQGRGADAQALLRSVPRAEWAPRQLHTVRSGETLSAIASLHQSSVSAIRAANDLKGSLIHPGQVLLVPRGTSTEPSRQPRREAAADGRYEVRTNDTPWDIARAFGIDVDTLLAANLLPRDAVITPGQRLVVPAASAPHHSTMTRPAPPTTYRVRSGDTLYGIARRFGTSVDELRAENRLRGTRIVPGDILRIPDGSGQG